jgi:hypothetical protein
LKRILILALALTVAQYANSQPYIDLVNTRFVQSPSSYTKDYSKTYDIQYFNVSTNLPIQLKKSKSILLVSPFVDRWILPSATSEKSLRLTSLALPVTAIFPVKNDWKLATTLILRVNDSMPQSHGQLQVGGALLGEKRFSENFQLRVGVYLNNELFGLFVVPLTGIDWKINNRSNLFGLLPGSLTYEYRLNKISYTGFAFRTLTNSYGVNDKYYRIDENQLGAYYDLYLTKHLVVNGEVGHSILRKIRTGKYREKGQKLDVNDAWYFKAAIAYRLRLR